MPREVYNTTPIKKRESDNSRVYGSWIPPKVAKSAEDTYIRSVVGDRLDVLAYEYYGDALKWKIIANANQLGKGTLAIPAGTQIRIPADPEGIIFEWTDQNNNR